MIVKKCLKCGHEKLKPTRHPKLRLTGWTISLITCQACNHNWAEAYPKETKKK